MPSLSGLHMWRTISSGHSSRASRSISTSSVSRFLANSRRDFRLNFKVLLAIMISTSFRGTALHFADFVRHLGQELQDVVDDANIGNLKNRSLRILVDSNNEWISLDTRQMLECPADAASQIDLRLDGLSRRAHPARFLQPLGIDNRTGATHGSAEYIGQFLRDANVVFLLNPAADGDQHVVLGDVDFASFGPYGFQPAPASLESASFGRSIHHHSGQRCAR